MMEKEYILYDFTDKVIEWEKVPTLRIEEFPWYSTGEKQQTAVQCAIREDVLHIKVYSEDKNIRAEAKVNNEAVYEDSCFEWFVTPVNQKGEDYFNIEVSCNGTIYMAYRDNTEGKRFASNELLSQIKIQSAVNESSWMLDLAIPLGILETMQGKPIDQETWYANFYRCGGLRDQQYACWNPLQYQRPNFHLPQQFGKLIISKI